MHHVQILILPLDDGFRAVARGTPLDSETLDGFGTRLEEALVRNLGGDVDVEYALSGDLKSKFRTCSTCHGSERVEVEGTVAGQWLPDEFSALDFSKKGTRICPACKGMGVEVPGFWRIT